MNHIYETTSIEFYLCHKYPHYLCGNSEAALFTVKHVTLGFTLQLSSILRNQFISIKPLPEIVHS